MRRQSIHLVLVFGFLGGGMTGPPVCAGIATLSDIQEWRAPDTLAGAATTSRLCTAPARRERWRCSVTARQSYTGPMPSRRIGPRPLG